MADEELVHANGVDLCVGTFGEPEAPAVLLISGAGASMDWWDAEFCERLAQAGRFVIRYDHRDTGRSTSYPPGAPGYTGADLAEDAGALIDTVAGGRAHLVGISMGGGIAQALAVQRPDRVATLTLMSTSPAFATRSDVELPAMTDRLKTFFTHPAPEPDWTDRAAVVEYLVDGQRPFAGPESFDEAQVRAVVHRVVDRTVRLESSVRNHSLIAGDGDGGAHALAEVSAPTLVIHGTEDPLFPPGHADALRNEISGAELLLLDGVGHQPPPRSTWDLVLPAISRHMSTQRAPTPR